MVESFHHSHSDLHKRIMGGNVINDFSPLLISATPTSQPRIASPFPRRRENYLLRLRERSKTLPFSNFPV
jgi:hypothetical protein